MAVDIISNSFYKEVLTKERGMVELRDMPHKSLIKDPEGLDIMSVNIRLHITPMYRNLLISSVGNFLD